MNKIIAIVIMVVALVYSAHAKISKETIDKGVETCLIFLESKEGFRSSWYCDRCQKGLAGPNSKCSNKKCWRKKKGKWVYIGTPTIGHGITKAYWTAGSITPAQSRAIKRRIVRADAMAFVAAAKIDLNANQLAALCSLAYRRGIAAVLRSKTWNEGIQRNNASTIRKEWAGFNTQGGIVRKGLVNRCNAEMNLFFK
jgi:GH24 family phage-related lysozyme (muramidase)